MTDCEDKSAVSKPPRYQVGWLAATAHAVPEGPVRQRSQIFKIPCYCPCSQGIRSRSGPDVGWAKAATAVQFERDASSAVPTSGAVVGTAELAYGKTQTSRPPLSTLRAYESSDFIDSRPESNRGLNEPEKRESRIHILYGSGIGMRSMKTE